MAVTEFRKSATERAFNQSGFPERPLIKKGFYLHEQLSRRQWGTLSDLQKKFTEDWEKETGLEDPRIGYGGYERHIFGHLFETLPDVSDIAALGVLFSQYNFYTKTLADRSGLPPFVRFDEEYARYYIGAVDLLDPRIGVLATEIDAARENPEQASGEAAIIMAFLRYDGMRETYDNALNMISIGTSYTDIEYLQKDFESFKALPPFAEPLARLRAQLTDNINRDMPKFLEFWNRVPPETADDVIETAGGIKISGLKHMQDVLGIDDDGKPVPPRLKP